MSTVGSGVARDRFGLKSREAPRVALERLHRERVELLRWILPKFPGADRPGAEQPEKKRILEAARECRARAVEKDVVTAQTTWLALCMTLEHEFDRLKAESETPDELFRDLRTLEREHTIGFASGLTWLNGKGSVDRGRILMAVHSEFFMPHAPVLLPDAVEEMRAAADYFARVVPFRGAEILHHARSLLADMNGVNAALDPCTMNPRERAPLDRSTKRGPLDRYGKPPPPEPELLRSLGTLFRTAVSGVCTVRVLHDAAVMLGMCVTPNEYWPDIVHQLDSEIRRRRPPDLSKDCLEYLTLVTRRLNGRTFSSR